MKKIFQKKERSKGGEHSNEALLGFIFAFYIGSFVGTWLELNTPI